LDIGRLMAIAAVPTWRLLLHAQRGEEVVMDRIPTWHLFPGF
jgi:hypothetical protein